jgi:hypothetical protein
MTLPPSPQESQLKSVKYDPAARLIAVLTGILFLFSSLMNLGLKIPLGFATLSFSNPLQSIAEFEILIGAILFAAAALSWLYVYGAAYVLSLVGIAFGLTSSDVQGLARSLHLVMLPFTIVGFVLLGLQVRSSYISKTDKSNRDVYRQFVLVLQFFVAGLVILGGAAYARDGTYPVGTVLGLIHLSIGFAGLAGGYVFLKRKPWSTKFLIIINGIIIGYSTFSESLAQIYSYLPPGFNDSLFGTIIALFVSAAIISLLVWAPPETGKKSTSAGVQQEKTRV